MVERGHTDELIDQASHESFPASDPPSWTAGADSDVSAHSSVPPPIGTVTAPMSTPPALSPYTPLPSALVARLRRDGAAWAAGGAAAASVLCWLSGRRSASIWLLQASSCLMLLAARQRPGAIRTA